MRAMGRRGTPEVGERYLPIALSPEGGLTERINMAKNTTATLENARRALAVLEEEARRAVVAA